jgi:hypothetical protein
MSIAVLLTAPVFAQGRGQGIGGVAGGVTGAVGHTANAPVGTGKAPDGKGAGASGDVGLRVTQNAGLSAQLQALLPSGTTLSSAAEGFHNEGQFVAALHVAHNLNIPFDQLKAKVTGTDAESLGKAIHSLRPSLDSKAIKSDNKLAEAQADRDLNAKTGSSPVASQVAANSNLAARLGTLLPQGMTLQSAAAGFKNQGQFIAALETAKNLNISFADLKDRVTAGQSLGEAIHALKPDMTPQTVAANVKQAGDQSVSIQAEASVRADASGKH